MNGDFTRMTFEPERHYSRVMMQQGRVALDADWNEQTSILLHYLRALTRDVFGPHAGPAADLGFELIGQPMTASQLQARFPGLDSARAGVLSSALDEGDIVICPGRYYVDGIMVENDRPLLYSEQLGYRHFPDPEKYETVRAGIQKSSANFLLYLDVWERHVSYLQDDSIREVALGGPDTCCRAQVVWQLRVFSARETLQCSAVDDLLQVGTGKLRAQARNDKPPQELCVIPPESNYRGPENQLYRVQVHQGGTTSAEIGGPTFKWSRENGSVEFPILKLVKSNGNWIATLGSLGRDRRFGLKPGDWVEVVDDAQSAALMPGALGRVEAVTREDSAVTLTFPAGAVIAAYNSSDVAAIHPLLRRWDHQGDLTKFDGALQILEQNNDANGLKNGWVELEDGVKIWFAKGGVYRPGDYWLIPARTITGDIEWPQEPDGAGKTRPAAVGPGGIHHHYAPILLAGAGAARAGAYGKGATVTDCRCRILRLPCVDYYYAFGGEGIGTANPEF